MIIMAVFFLHSSMANKMSNLCGVTGNEKSLLNFATDFIIHS